ncbi:CAP domain-containing protein [Halovivax gelatinilyticus]|uniref:CAP domain-containing protein n=1 Tax=Halovivax gelatinilyticus TaxID=2961597 RepID=UPI0020CA71C1|nr:CAP domain-containing protein [Halovivax gelatinilyticus]
MVASRPDPASDGTPPTDRGLLGVFRALIAFSIVVALAAGFVLFVPDLVDDLLYEHTPIETETPPAAGDRTPEVRHAADPVQSSYEGDVEIRSDHVEDFVHHEINDVRAEHGLDPLVWDATIASVSRGHSADMAQREYFAHDNPEGESPMDRFQTTGDYCQRYGENIAQSWVDRAVESGDGGVVEYTTPEEAAEGLVDQWMNSPPHREAILNDEWDRAGVGVYLTDDGMVFATQNFCTEW